MTIELPKGFQAGAAHCGVKSDASREDLALFVCPGGAAAAGVYTENLVVAAPVVLDRARTPADNIRVVVVNSGNANACTGAQGMKDAKRMTQIAAAACQAEPEQALVMSTGIIGEFLPMDKIEAGIKCVAQTLGNDHVALIQAARGLMTTDRSPKVASKEVRLAGGAARITAVAKGAGMIGPRMATMLCVVMTDVALASAEAQRALTGAVNESFNCMSVEGHMSTNDTVLLLSSGASGLRLQSDDEFASFQQSLNQVCIEMAREIADDGEGASHLITIDVRQCASRDDALQIAKTIATSALVKTAVTGADPNWGRIISAAGYSGVTFNPDSIRLSINDHVLFENGSPAPFDAKQVSQSMAENRETRIVLTLQEGEATVRFWTSDLTVAYVRLNSEYHT